MFQNDYFSIRPVSLRAFVGLSVLCLTMFPFASAQAQEGGAKRPALVISNSPIPKEILENAYSAPAKVRDITASELTGSNYYKPSETMVSRKVGELQSELAILQDKVVVLSKALTKVQRENEGKAAQYYAAVATINTQLQAGTTPGNPRLVERFSTAERTLDDLGAQVSDLNQLAIDASRVATETSFLLDSARSSYSLSGAVEEDHILLAKLEDQVNSNVVMVERLLTTINDDLERTNAYMAAERDNLRILSLAVTEGSFYGRGLANRPFSGTGGNASTNYQQAAYVAPPAPVSSGTPQPLAGDNYTPQQQQESLSPAPSPLATPQQGVAQPSSPSQGLRPLVKIMFDSSNVDYEQPLYLAVNEALERYPNTIFTVIGLHPAAGNAAESAIESTRARRNTKRVLRTLSQIGVADNQVNVSYEATPNVSVNEVHVYIQ